MLPMPSIVPPEIGDPGVDGHAVPVVRMPQMEFIFRTLVEMKMDLEDLRAEFERYRQRHPELSGVVPEPDQMIQPIEISSIDSEDVEASENVNGPDVSILLTPAMTMDDVEREVIRIALAAVGGNRRRAAERLGIGERTLYRKLRQYDLEH